MKVPPLYRRLIALLSVPLLAACAAPKAWVVLLPNEDGSTGSIIVSGPEGQTEVDQAGMAASLDTPVPQTFTVSEQEVAKTFGQAIEAQPPLPSVFTLYFELGGTDLTAESQALLPEVLAEVVRRPGADISIVGHTDTAGSDEDNQVLGMERAEYVRDEIMQIGLQLERISVESHGEGNPLIGTPDETPEPRNRRVEIVVR